ncbi:hypothetical protein MMC16_005131 [Acarospora aff. strigata]|nr:hypothetical protein [Acarospora aff. strigata]
MAPKEASVKKTKLFTARASAGKQGSKGRKPDHGSAYSAQGVAQQASIIPTELQQLLLNVFKDSFSTEIRTDLSVVIQEVKQYLFNRDFVQAFGNQEYLQAYAIRWSPSRALAYLEVFANISYLRERFIRSGGVARATSVQPEESSCVATSRLLDPSLEDNGSPVESPLKASDDIERAFKILCLGGGAGAEIVALAGYARYMRSCFESGQLRNGSIAATSGGIVGDCVFKKIVINTVDIADWSQVVNGLCGGVTTAPHLSQYSSSAAKAANKSLVAPEDFSCTFYQRDILAICVEDLASLLEDTTMVTLMFTLNELYSISMVRTTNFLLSLTSFLKKGALLLVVDSPGSYSTVAVGGSREVSTGSTLKKYPMQWLLDHTLLEASSTESSRSLAQGGQWEKLLSDDSRWFRLPEGLQYPVALENMRYQIHLYRHR